MRLVYLLLLSFLLNDLLLALGLFRKTYDAYTHMFLASHHARHWFENWNPRWFGGFDQFGYPPLVHQVIAGLSWVFGLDVAYGLVQLGANLLITLGVYRFVEDRANEEVAQWACGLSIFSTALVQATHMFGQLPFLMALGVLLNALPFFARGVRDNDRPALVAGLALLSLVATLHHITLFFGAIFFVLPMSWALVFDGGAFSRVRVKRVLVSGFGVMAVAAFLTIPFFYFLKNTGAQQAIIPHGTRANFLFDRNALIYFFLVPYSTFLPLIPFAVKWSFRWPQTRPFVAVFIALFVLGLGGTTPLARWVLGKQFDTLTMDRFAVWAIVILHFLVPGYLVAEGKKRGLRILLGATAATALILAGAIRLFPFQPEAIDMEPLLQFADAPQNRDYRYLTLGMGAQFAWLGAQTETPSIDGNYFAARLIPELRLSGIEALDGAKYFKENGEKTLAVFLGRPERFALRYVFCNDDYYSKTLQRYGWKRRQTLTDSTVLWEHPAVPEIKPNDVVAKVVHPVWVRALSGSYPLWALLAMFLVWRARKRIPA